MVTTKLRSTKLQKLPRRRRVTRLKPTEFISPEAPIEKRRIIPIPIIIPSKVKIKPTKPTKITPNVIKRKGIPLTPAQLAELLANVNMGKRVGPVQGGPVKSSVATAVRYYPQSLLMVIDFHGGAQYEYYAVEFELFNYVYNGLGTATTDGENQYGRWWKGKSNPSVGASIRRRLYNEVSYRRVR